MYQLKPEVISDRAAAVGDSITLRIGALAKQMKAEGKDILSFSQGEPDFDTPAIIKLAGIEAIQQGKTKYNRCLRYSPAQAGHYCQVTARSGARLSRGQYRCLLRCQTQYF